jgi:phospholipid/cholesterol/gamma-HCH transport system substrate-binding protein
LGSAHIELAPPTDVPPEGKLMEGALIPLSSAGAHPSTEETLAAVAMVLNGGGVGHVQDIVTALSTAVTGRENDLKSLIEQSDTFVGHLNDQKDDIVSATDSLNSLVGQFAEQRPVIDKALETVPQALTVLKDEREVLADAAAQGGKLSALVTETVEQTKENLVKELHDLGPVLKSLADAGPSLTRSLDLLSTLPFPKPTLEKWIRGDYANLTAVVDLTLSRIDASLFTGTRWEGDLTELELQWGRTIGQMPSPYTAANPLVAPYRFDQGP